MALVAGHEEKVAMYTSPDAHGDVVVAPAPPLNAAALGNLEITEAVTVATIWRSGWSSVVGGGDCTQILGFPFWSQAGVLA